MDKAEAGGRILFETRRSHGQLTATVLCACGDTCELSLWSWAGRGRAKCPSCGAALIYLALRGRQGQAVAPMKGGPT